MKKVIVTCGGTSEPVDDVRVLTNISTGRFGHALALELATFDDYSVEQYCPKATVERLGQESIVEYKHYRTTEDLRALLHGQEKPPAIVLQAAAISDYRPVKAAGKLSSDADTMTIHLERTPKVISELRPLYGSKTFLVGFKLLSGVSEDELIEAAFAQLKKNRLNMVIANDLQNLKDNNHPVLAITAEGGVIPFYGNRLRVARALAAFIHKREQVQWFQSVKTEGLIPADDLHERFSKTLATAHRMNLLTDASGNISVRSELAPSNLLVSPRGVDKSVLKDEDALLAQADTASNTIYFDGEGKPSIDTGMESLLYENYEKLAVIMHFHRGWGMMDVKTEFPYPCGVQEEAEEIINVAAKANLKNDSESIAVELIHHGFVLGLTVENLNRLNLEWDEVLGEFDAHLVEIKQNNDFAPVDLDRGKLQPIWHGASIKGLLYNSKEGAIVYLRENARGTGLGRVIIDQLITRKYTIQTVTDCKVRDFYKKFGFVESETNGVFTLSPPFKALEKEWKF